MGGDEGEPDADGAADDVVVDEGSVGPVEDPVHAEAATTTAITTAVRVRPERRLVTTRGRIPSIPPCTPRPAGRFPGTARGSSPMPQSRGRSTWAAGRRCC